jgi:vacuolar-type H+-ATPase catalytic subunit A/Vma1
VLPVLFVVTLLAGVIAGASLTVITIRHHVQQALLYPEQKLHKVATRLQRRLDLTDEQTRQVEDVFLERNESLQAIRRDVHPKVVEEMDRMYQDVAAILDEEQSRKWKRMYHRLRRSVPPPLPAT